MFRYYILGTKKLCWAWYGLLATVFILTSRNCHWASHKKYEVISLSTSHRMMILAPVIHKHYKDYSNHMQFESY